MEDNLDDRLGRSSPAAAVAPGDDDPIRCLLSRGVLSDRPSRDIDELTEHLQLQRSLSERLKDVKVLRICRVENPALSSIYEAVKGTMGGTRELDLWHGTSSDCMGNIVTNGFNRAYSGRHGTKLGMGTYFSTDVEYSLRFCGRRDNRSSRMVLLARVLVGVSTRGMPELVEPPYRDHDRLERFDSTVDCVEHPRVYCVFRDFQALPRYIVELI